MGGYMTCRWTGSAAWFLERYPLLITETCCHTHFHDGFRRKTTHFWLFFASFCKNPPIFMENLPKKGPLFREFWAQNPTHMGGTYPYPQHVMYPPPPEEGEFSADCSLLSIGLESLENFYIKCVKCYSLILSTE